MIESIVLGGGCFWCIEALFNQIKGVVKVTSGYAGGTVKNPTYEMVCSGNTGQAEVVKVDFDPRVISLKEILEVFWEIHDPTTKDRQGHDVGTQYRSIILYTNEDQKATIGESIRELDKPITTEVNKLDEFYPAEDYHQNYYENNKDRPYCSLVISPKLNHLRNWIKNR